jgi:hypothetical protein
LLDIQFEYSQIVEGKGTIIDTSVIFMIKSPASISVEFNNDIYNEEDGIIFIPDAKSGNYNLKVLGTDQGEYEVVVGQISEKGDLWESINGETNISQIDDYNILYNDKMAQTIFPTPTVTPISGSEDPTPTPTGQIYLSPTILATIPQFRNSPAEILGISSHQKEWVTPTVKLIKKTKTKKSINILDFVWSSLIISTIVETIWLIRKRSMGK